MTWQKYRDDSFLDEPEQPEYDPAAAAEALGDDGADAVPVETNHHQNGRKAITRRIDCPQEWDGPDVEIESLTSAEFFAKTYEPDYLIQHVLHRDQNAIIGGAMKCMKTTIMLDMALSLGGAAPFLGKFFAQQATVGIISGESGEATLQETARRIAATKGRLPSLAKVHWSFKLPCLMQRNWQRALVRWVERHGIEVVCIDPTYLALLDANTARGASNLMVMGTALRELSDVVREAEVTPILNHHVGKTAARESMRVGDPPDLMDLSMSGFGEFARQWLLIGRREKYVAGTGEHKLWLNVGGSAGHSGLYALDINEGKAGDPGGRRWELDILSASEAHAAAAETEAEKRDAKRRERQTADQDQAKERIRKFLQKRPTGETYSKIRDSLGSSRPIRDAFVAMQESGELVDCEIEKNGRTETAWKLKPSAPGTVGAPGTPTDLPSGAPVVGRSPL